MSSPYHDVNIRASAALRANPTAVAGLTEFDDRPGDLRTALSGLAGCVRAGRWHPPSDAGGTLYAMIRVAQEEYGSEDRGYWPHLAESMSVGAVALSQPDQSRLGGWFRDALHSFGYPTNIPGLANLGPILWHAGWSRPHLPPLVAFVAGQVAVYGGRAAEPDAPHALRLGEAAREWIPQLPRTIVRLLDKDAAGVGELWARLAGAVLAGKQGADAVRDSWEPIGGITADDIVAAMPVAPRAGVPVLGCPRRPRLRYHPDTGELRLWLLDGMASDWQVEGLRVAWRGDSAEVQPPLPDRFTLTHRPTQVVWTEVLCAGDRPAVWFGGRSGVLERGDEVATQGLSAGCYYLVCRGTPAGLPPAARCPLSLGYYAGGEGWAAWEVEVPARAGPAGPSGYTIRVDGTDWRFSLARGAVPLLRVDGGVVTQGELPDGARVALFAGPPRVELRSGTAVRLVRRNDGAAEPMAEWVAGSGVEAVRDRGPGVYQLREARGVGRVLLDYAVLPGLGVPALTVVGDSARLTVTAGPGGRLEGGTAVPGGWAVERPTWEPWLVTTWRWDAGGLPVTLRVAVRAARWRLADPNGALSGWTREPLAVGHRDAAARRLRLQVEVPDRDGVLVNGSLPAADPVDGPTGWGLTLPLDAFPAADAIHLRVGGREYVTAWLSDRPVLRSFETILGEGVVLAFWDAEYVPPAPVLGVWDPTDPGGQVVSIGVSREQVRDQGGEWALPAEVASARQLAVSLGSMGAGFGARPFQPATSADGSPVTALASRDGTPPDAWMQLAHRWTVCHRWGDGVPAPIGTDLRTLGGDLPWREVLGYTGQLPVGSRLRASLTDVLSRAAGPAAAEQVAAAADPTAVLRGWLSAGVHPFWTSLPATRPKSDDHGYPAGYLWDLAVLDDPGAGVEQKRAAADAVVNEHADRELFPPICGLPLAAGAASGGGLLADGRDRDRRPHRHRLAAVDPRSPQGPEWSDADDLLAQTSGHDAYWLATAGRGDMFPSTTLQAAATVGGRVAVRAAQYSGTRYRIGWSDDGYWELDRSQGHTDRQCSGFRPCCRLDGPLTVAGWRPDELVERLGLVGWLLRHSAGVSAPKIALAARFETLLYAGPLAVVHRRVLEPPPILVGQLDGQKFNVIGGGLALRTPAYPDIPPAGKLAWRLGWLDRLSAAERAKVADWSPLFTALAVAVAHSPQFARLLAGCIVTAEYVCRVLAGGIGPVVRFSPSPTKDARP